jgi:hypothetical protein
MSDLFGWFQSYLNLSKITAVTVPGMVVAFALILVLGPIPCADNSKSCPFCSATLKPSSPPENSTGPLSLLPKTLTFVNGVNTQRKLKLTNTGNSDVTIFKVFNSVGDADSFLTDSTACDAKVLSSGKDCTIVINYHASHLSLSWFRPNSIPRYEATLSVIGIDTSSDETIEATASLVWGPDPSSVSEASGASSQKKKGISNTVVTSSATWLNAGADSPFASPQVSASNPTASANSVTVPNQTTPLKPKPGSVPIPPPSRDSLLAKFEDLLPPQYKSEETTLKSSCGKMPLYVVPNSRPASDKSDNKTGDNAKSKPGVPQYSEETTRSIEEILSTSDSCYADLTRLDEDLQKEIAKAQNISTQDITDLGALSSNLLTAQNSGDTLVARDLSRKINVKKKELQDTQEHSKSLSQADSYVASLLGQASTIRNAALSQANTASATPSTSNTVADVFLTIEQNLIKFLLFSLILGQILDPIQRGLVSFVGPRRNVFEVLNRVYGQKGDGEFRYGDRRVPPWTLPDSFLPTFYPPQTPQEAQELRDFANESGLRYGPADFAFLRNMNIYDQNYAIGAGYISQNEFNNIYDDYYTQSQLTSGLILPLVILSVCIGIRIICCMTFVPTGPTAWRLIGPVLGAMYIGMFSGFMLSFVFSYFGSREYGEVFHEFITNLRERSSKSSEDRPRVNVPPIFRFLRKPSIQSDEKRWRKFIPWVLFGLFLFFAFLIGANSNVLGWDVLPLVAIPCAFALPLWIWGLDRLHKFYSELQARIGGNILRLQQNTQQKMVDLITQSESLDSLQQNLSDAAANNAVLIDFLNQFIEQKNQNSGANPPTQAGGGSQ